VLYFLLELGHIGTCKFLLNLEVDPYFEDDSSLDLARIVSSYIYTHGIKSSWRRLMNLHFLAFLAVIPNCGTSHTSIALSSAYSQSSSPGR